MICHKCGLRGERIDCTEEELKYRLCTSCIEELREKGVIPPKKKNGVLLIDAIKQCIENHIEKGQE